MEDTLTNSATDFRYVTGGFRTIVAEAKSRLIEDEDRDDLDDYLDDQLQDPAFRQAFDDAAARAALLQKLIECRKSVGLSQGAVADCMATTQSAVSDFEGGATDPRLSTIQRYARAVGKRIGLVVENDWSMGWVYVAADIKPTEGEAFEFDWQPKKLDELLEHWNVGTRTPGTTQVVIGSPAVDELTLAS